MEKKSSKKEFHNLCIILGFFLFLMMRMMASLGRQPHPIVGVFGIMGGAYLYISIFLPSLGILFFFFFVTMQFAIYLRLHETKGNLKIKPQYRCCQSCDANVLVATNFLN